VPNGIKVKTVGGCPTASYFLLLRQKKVTKEKATLVCRPLRGFPALLGKSGGCGTRATRSDSPRRNPLTCLCYSAALKGMKSHAALCALRARFFFGFGEAGIARLTGWVSGFGVLIFYPLCTASIRRERAVGLGEHCLSTWPRSGSCELRNPARW